VEAAEKMMTEAEEVEENNGEIWIIFSKN